MPNPNYANFLVDPRPGITAGVNAFQNAQRIGLEGRRVNEFERRGNIYQAQEKRVAEQYEFEKSMRPVRAAQMKTKHVSQFAARALTAPPGQIDKSYETLYKRILPMPIGYDPQYGPLGAVPENIASKLYLTPDDFKKLSETDKREYLRSLAYTHEQIAELDMSRQESQMELNKIMRKWRVDQDLARQKHQQAMTLEGEKGRQDRLTEGKKAAGQGKLPADVKAAQDTYHKMMSKVNVESNIIQLFMTDPSKAEQMHPETVKLLKDQLTGEDLEVYENARSILLDYFSKSAGKLSNRPKRMVYDPTKGTIAPK